MKIKSGFTLVEFIITLTVAVIALALAAPSFSELIQNNRIAAQTNELVNMLHLARSEAVTRSTAVSVCASGTGSSCTATDWRNGWIVFIDGDTAGTVDGTDTILKVYQAAGGPSVTSDGFANPRYIRYGSTGRADSTGTFTICRPGLKGRLVYVSATGGISTTLTADACPRQQ